MKKTFALMGILLALCTMTGVHAQLDSFNKRPADAKWWQEISLLNAAKIQNAKRQTEVYRHIAVVQAKAGLAEDAAATFAKAREAAAYIPGIHDKVTAYVDLALAQTEVGDEEGAKATLKLADRQMLMVSDTPFRVKSEALFAEAFHRVGDKANYEKWIKAALTEANTIERLRDRSPMKLFIVKVMLRSGELASAEELIKDIWYIEQRSAGYIALCNTLVKQGKIDEALAIVKKLRYQVDQIGAYLGIAQAYAATDKQTEAVEMANKAISICATIPDPDVKARMMIQVASALVPYKLSEPVLQALSEAESASEAFDKASFSAWALPQIAMLYGLAGESNSVSSTLDKAQGEAESLKNAMAKAWALGRIAQVRATYDRDNLDGTVDATKVVLEDTAGYPTFNAILLSYLATAQAKAGKTAEFRNTIVEADAQLKRIVDNVEYGTAAVDIHATQTELEAAIAEQAKILAQEQKMDEALTVTSYLLFNPEIRQQAYVALARQEAIAGDEGRVRLANWLDIRFEQFDGRALGALEVVKVMLLK